MPFKWGALTRIARAAGLSRQALNNILHGRRHTSVRVIEKLVEESRKLGYTTCVFDWWFPGETKNHLFRPYQKRRK